MNQINKLCVFNYIQQLENTHFLKLECNCFAMLCYFLLYSKVSQLYSIPISPPSWTPPKHPTSHPSRSSQSTELSSLCYTAASQWPSVLHRVVVYICQCWSLNSSHPLLSPPCLQVCSLHLRLYSCPANRFIGAIFLDSPYICFPFWLTSLYMTDSGSIHVSTNDPISFLVMVE